MFVASAGLSRGDEGNPNPPLIDRPWVDDGVGVRSELDSVTDSEE